MGARGGRTALTKRGQHQALAHSEPFQLSRGPQRNCGTTATRASGAPVIIAGQAKPEALEEYPG
jgi:hypothetical protein